MIRTLGFQDKFYLVICADIECMILANSFEEAAANGLKKILNKLGLKTNLSFLISVDLINNHLNRVQFAHDTYAWLPRLKPKRIFVRQRKRLM